MPTSTQEVLTKQPHQDPDRAFGDKTGRRRRWISVSYIGRLASIAAGIAAVIAFAAGSALYYRFGFSGSSMYGAMLILWSATTLMLSIAMGLVVYWKRRKAPTLP
jgi:hypothetical protein